MAVAAPERELARQLAAAAAGVTAFAQDVLAGNVVANRYVRLACERHINDLSSAKARGLRWDDESAGHAIRFFDLLRLAEGEFEGKPFVLSPWQVFIVGSLFGWYSLDEDGVWVRRFRNAYVETGKGSGKSPLAGGIGLYGMAADSEATAEVYSAAAGRDQAGILWTDAKRMVEKSSELRARIEVLAHALVARSDSASFKPVSAEAK
ncbi:MAG: terminase large subunit domain-containing protein, partial [Solirubrobacteraceae bacterium]